VTAIAAGQFGLAAETTTVPVRAGRRRGWARTTRSPRSTWRTTAGWSGWRALLLDDAGAAEEVVQDAYVRMHGSWRRIRDPQAAVGYLRTTVVNLARSRLRHKQVARRHAPAPLPDAPSAEQGALDRLEHHRVVAALRALPERQRECLVLRYYGDLSEAEIAAAMGISPGAVKSHASRGMAALRSALEARRAH
jgi:RNA polymerase sigma-70 factor (sigma-E family)